ncbi:hypothetical protein FHS43_001843 [Streptosporangium becharense]|uniref:DUF397 domain-containing protein n=1 Tax=Streptosporangium becharense TaxID=1816182 RepID=A0A7W9IM83_9ACTN|nr:DUF397 domain-containing protein [Streptosporangium becharense]MBB2910580.1 hypothetical protein [Streptosporangium becharense]MBB5823323.1 hypothetical protein [Streptosporangium becharense]
MDQELSGATWVKSSLSGGNGGECVEIARLSGGRVAVRDSKDPSGPALVFTSAEWTAFTRRVRTDVV